MSISKVIHYCWFGGKPLPESAQKCIASWKKFCPDYEIKEWNESNFDIDCCAYVREAYDAKMWAYVSDYARFKILYEHGGLYFDTDVELIKPISDIVENGPFLGLEETGNALAANAGLGLAANAGLGLYQEILTDYENSHFGLGANGGYKTVVVRVTDILKAHGYVPSRKISKLGDITIYPPEYFCPLNYFTGEMCITDNTRSIHHYTATWVKPEDKMRAEIRRRFFGKGKALALVGSVLSFPLRIIGRIRKSGLIGSVKYMLNRGKNKGE